MIFIDIASKCDDNFLESEDPYYKENLDLPFLSWATLALAQNLAIP
jgi:hypothetical protein